jgi:hypothetical protein
MWRIEHSHARWESNHFQASVEPARPGLGLTDVRVGDSSLAAGNLLQIHVAAQAKEAGREIQDCYARGSDLIVTYAETSHSPVCPQIYWRIIDTPDAWESVTIDAIVSNQTQLLDTDPRMRIGCSLPSDSWLRTHRPGTSSVFDHVSMRDGETVSLEVKPPGCALLVRLAGVAWSYGQIIEAIDLIDAELVWNAAKGTTTLWAEVFENRLEKGVIRRARARGVVVPRERDEELVARHFENVVRSAPPLTT